jgi:hypothetical protein
MRKIRGFNTPVSYVANSRSYASAADEIRARSADENSGGAAAAGVRHQVSPVPPSKRQRYAPEATVIDWCERLLLEISLCAVGAHPGALITERSHRAVDRSTIAGRKLLAWQRRAALPLISNAVPLHATADDRKRLAQNRRRKLVALGWLGP